jgi:hypothetical protein
MLDRFKAGQDWPVYEQAYQALIEQRDMLRLWQEVASGFERPCLLCAEKTPDQCHRRLLGECLSKAKQALYCCT